ncbi:hypothetical protein V6N11_022367 [Hibiscus sabdariffa]|uniref:F-box domain-containing protein n=1 Tax=Hibiscus sabdariffa TaxID=183260 RepID=A0ABR2TIY2_9ROSI
MILTKQYRCIHSSSCQCTKGHLSEDVIFLVFQQLNWNPKLIANLSCVCKWFDDLSKRVLWKEFCKTRAPKMMLDLQSSGSHSVDGNWRALGKLLIYCSGCSGGRLFNSVEIPGHFVYRTRFSRTSGKSFLLPQCRTDILYVSDPCEHLDQGEEGDVGFFRGVFKSFLVSKVRKMLIDRAAKLHPTAVCPYCKAKLWDMLQAKMIPQSASCRVIVGMQTCLFAISCGDWSPGRSLTLPLKRVSLNPGDFVHLAPFALACENALLQRHLRRSNSPIDESSDCLIKCCSSIAFELHLCIFRVKLSKRMKGEEENGFFFGLATVPAHVEDKLNDAWVQFAEENPCHISETSDDPMEADAVIGVAADGGSHCAP